jgi:ectoine hydroxylase-related dioxygenase (phytanoyl-CoA dioxygenase family)
MLPDDDDITFYREHGYWISPVIVPQEVLDTAQRGMDRHYGGDFDADWPGLGDGWRPEHGAGLRKNDYSSLRVRELAELVAYPTIAATAAVLAGAASIRLWHDQLLCKPASAAGAGTSVGWHTDRQYWLTCSSTEMLTAWVGFHDVDERSGSVSFLDGSHRWNVTGLDFFDQDLGRLEAAVASQGFPIDRRSTSMRRGQVSFHHCGTVHGSGPNQGSEPRRSLVIHLQPGDNRWSRNVLPDGTLASHANDQLVRHADGVPDYTDPLICPSLWSATL